MGGLARILMPPKILSILPYNKALYLKSKWLYSPSADAAENIRIFRIDRQIIEFNS